LKKIVRTFGKTILKPDETLDRSALAEIVFKNAKKRKLLESIIHPEVVKVLKERIAASKKKTVAVDIPLLYEVGLQGLVDTVCVVWCPLEQQIARLQKRNELSRSEALRRIRSQWPLARKKKLADCVIDNSSTVKQAFSQVCHLLHLLT
jgi:dephospho-CoA kinase